MAKETSPSRFNPLYLARRHGGAVFLFLALGLAAGTAWHCLVEPRSYHAEARVDMAAVPASEAAGIDWDAKRREWNGLFLNSRDTGLLGNNLRHLYKRSLTRDMALDPAGLDTRLAFFTTPQEFSASLFANPLLARLGPTVTVSLRDLTSNLDYQSLALIVSDLDPPGQHAGWDFSFFQPGADSLEDAVIVRSGPEDRFFRVFYYLHDALNPERAAVSPEDAWQTAVDFLSERLRRETEFSGGGRFGQRAAREIERELLAIPALAANGLYHSGGRQAGENGRAAHALWAERWARDMRLDLTEHGGAGATLSAHARMELRPLGFPRDTAITRLPPLMAVTVLAQISAREKAPPPTPAPPVKTTPEPEPRPAPEPARVGAGPRRPVLDEREAEKRRRDITQTNAILAEAGLEQEAAHRRLETARDGEKRLLTEALAARARADRLAERHDAAALFSERDWQPAINPETEKLLAAREEAVRRLTDLLQRCTEEHPFVREVRRDIAALDIMLAGVDPEAATSRQAEARATRLANLLIELEAATVLADNLEERLRRQVETVACVLEEVEKAERRVVELNLRLLQLREAPLVMAPPAREPMPLPASPEPVPVPTPASEPDAGPSLAFAAVPVHVSLLLQPSSSRPIFVGLLLGLFAGLAWMVVSELLTSRFRNAYEARHMLGRKILAALPAYDPGRYRAAAATMKGELAGSRARGRAFIPAPVEFAEPAAAGRRGKVTARRFRPRMASWLAGALLAVLAACILWYAAPGLDRSLPGYPDELSPAASAGARDIGETTGTWGNLP